MFRNLVLYMGVGVLIGILTFPWRRALSEKIHFRLCLWAWACFWPLLLIMLAFLGVQALIRKATDRPE